MFYSSGVNASIEYILEVSNIFPLTGSLLGGTRLTVSGSGFSSNTSDNSVIVGEQQLTLRGYLPPAGTMHT